MAAVVERLVLPPPAESSSLPGLAAALTGTAGAALVGPDGEHIALPQELFEVLRQAAVAMARGQAITIAPHDAVLTTQAAAELIGVSRPTLVRLLESGKIPFTQPGRHRRVALADLIEYRDNNRAARRATLDLMTTEAAEDDSYEHVNGFVQTRR
jgi:excisionase family DNA binding protein